MTGASGGLGREAALRLAAAGARVAAWGRSAEALEALRQDALRACEAGAPEPELRLTTCDLADPEAVERAVGELLEDWGGIDVLVNNAGVLGTPAALERKSPAEMARVLRVNALAPMLLAQAVLPVMARQETGGTIVSVSSAAGVMGCAGAADYCASKFALFGFMESLRLEVRARGLAKRIACVTVCPGYIAHVMAPGAGPTAEPAAPAPAGEGEGECQKKKPPGGLLSLDEVASAVVEAAAGRTSPVVLLPRSMGSLVAARALYPPAVCDRLFGAFSQLPLGEAPVTAPA